MMTDRDICLMHHIVSKSLLNLPFFMIDVMRKVLNRSKAPLPYGMALTVIFRESGMSFEGEIVCRLSNTDTYNDHSLRRMEFVRVDGRWAKGCAATAEEKDDEEEHAEGEGPPSPPMPRQSPVDHPISEPKAGSSVSVPPSSSRIVPSFSLGEDDMGLLAETVVDILSVQQ